MSKTKLIFDIDGVLIDTRRSYRWAIKKTAEHFLNRTVPIADVDAIKTEEGMNNDWVATHALINAYPSAVPASSPSTGSAHRLTRRNMTLPLNKGESSEGGRGFDAVKQVFQDIYLGTSVAKGLRWKETSIFSPADLRKLSKRYGTFSIITGRTLEEAEFVLDRFGLRPFFDQIVSVEDTNPNDLPLAKGEWPKCRGGIDKSNPILFAQIRDIESFQKIIYIGDNVSDILLGRNGKTTLPVTMVLFTPIATRDERKILYQKADKYQPDQRFEHKEALMKWLNSDSSD